MANGGTNRRWGWVRGVVVVFAVVLGVRAAAADDLKLWYAAPAAAWNEGLLIGNGHMGGVVWGTVAEERIDLNEDTLWSGEPDYVVNPEARGALPEVRKLLLAGKLVEAQALVNQKMSGKESAVYLPLGDLRIAFAKDVGTAGAVTEYRRELDLATAIIRVSYQQAGVHFSREIFASNPGRAIVVRLTADQPGKISFAAKLASPLRNEVKADAGTLRMTGRAPMKAFDLAHKSNPPVYDDGPELKGMRFAARLAAENIGGQVRVTDQGVVAENCDAVTLIVAAETSYNGPAKSPSRQAKDEIALSAEDLRGSKGQTYQQLRAAHVADYQKLFQRVTLDLGHSAAAEALPTDERIKRYQPGGDPGLAALYYQFGRYVLIASSRDGGQAANLQGLWNARMNPPWASNYTINCNTEINYWPVEAANLAECDLPLIEMVKELSVDGARVAREFYGATGGGWVAHHATDIWKFAEPCAPPPGDARWMSFQCGGTWLCQDLWEHYAFSGDTAYLRGVWPVMKGAAQFHLDTLMEEPAHHWLVTGPDIDFENPWKQPDWTTGSICMGPTASMQMVRELFENCVKASRILNVDAEFRAEIEKTLPRLPPMQISPTTGELQEYLEDWQRTANCQALSSWGAICASQITPRGTPALAAGLRKIFDGERWWEKDNLGSWEGAFQSNLYARLGDGDAAIRVLNLHLQKAVNPNLGSKFIKHSNVFQIDGNLGQTAAIGEMLLQSQVCDAAGVYQVELLPALPKAWADGEVKGLRARGGLEVDIAWKAGRFIKVRLTSAKGGKWRLRYGAAVVEMELRAGETRQSGVDAFQ